jgi:hypothetical protein
MEISEPGAQKNPDKRCKGEFSPSVGLTRRLAGECYTIAPEQDHDAVLLTEV